MSSIHRTGIPYLTHHWPIATGCLPDQPCWQRCWARAMAHRFHRDFTPTFHPERLDDPTGMRGTGHVVGVAFGGDLGLMTPGNVAGVLDACADRTDLHFVIPTKRPGPLADAMLAARHDPAKECVILLTSVSTQADADERIPHLMRLAAAGWKVGVSVEPMLGPVSLRWLAAWNGMAIKPREWGQSTSDIDGARLLSWVICGGESGPGARPMHTDWARSLRDQCKAAGVPFFLKQMDAHWPESDFREVETGGKVCWIPALDGAVYVATPWQK